jgi:hypothetical protein
VNGQLGLQLGNAPLGGRQLRLLSAGRPGNKPLVNAVLAPPGIDRLLADPQTPGDVSDPAPGLNKIKDLSAEPRR